MKQHIVIFLLLIGVSAELSAQNVGINITSPQYDLDIRSLGTDDGVLLNVGNLDNSHFLRLYSGKATIFPFPAIYWNQGDSLSMGTNLNGYTELLRLRSDGTMRLNSEKGIRLDARDRPLITRGWDPFISGPYAGLGRWGLFMEPFYLTLGVPNVPGRGLQFVTYNDDSTIDKVLLRMNTDGKLGISTATPAHPVHIVHASPLSDDEPVMHVEYTGTNLEDVIAVRGKSRPADFYGIGGEFEGGYIGVRGKVAGTGAEAYYGVSGDATGTSGIKVGVLGNATGGGTNWAGFFGNGNVYIAKRLGIATLTPAHPVHIVHASSLIDDEPVMHVEYTGPNSGDAIAVRGKCRPADFVGYGGVFEGGYVGVQGKVLATGSNVYIGVHGQALGSGGSRYGIVGDAQGNTGTKYGVFGSAIGSGTNWAGYFTEGNVYIQNRLGINRTPVTNPLEVEGNASKSSAGDWLANSDARLKKNIRHLDSGEMLEKLLALEGISYEWDDQVTGSVRPEGTQLGFTAQNIQQVFPDLVMEDNLGYLQTAYSTYDPVLVEAIRALSESIAILRNENTILRDELRAVAARCDRIEAQNSTVSRQ